MLPKVVLNTPVDPAAIVVVSTFAVLVISAGAAQAQQVSLAAQAQTNAAVFRGQIGRHITFICPGNVNVNQDIYGTDVYTDTSPVCAAAAHAGVFTRGTSTAVTIVMGAGAQTFVASTRNSVTSLAYGTWSSTYTFARSGQPGQIDWGTTIAQVEADYLDPIPLVCPAGGQSAAGEIWGTDVYAYDSAICVAAVHGGVIALSGGAVTVTRVARQASFPSTTRNGITSRSWSDPAWHAYPQPYSVSNALPAANAGTAGTGAVATSTSASGSAPSSSGLAAPASSVAGVVAAVDAAGVGSVSWQAVTGAISYFVVRWLDGDPSCCANVSPPQGIASLNWQDSALPKAGTWWYRVYATTATGIVSGEASVQHQGIASGVPALRTIALSAFNASGGVSFPAPRAIDLAAFAATGPIITVTAPTRAVSGLPGTNSSPAVPAARTITIPAFTAAGSVIAPPPRTITLPAFTATGKDP